MKKKMVRKNLIVAVVLVGISTVMTGSFLLYIQFFRALPR